MSCAVYVIKSEPGPVKVGIAAKPSNRFHCLQTASAVPLSLAYIGVCGDDAAAKKIEAEAHRILRARHHRGESFSVPVEDAVCVVMNCRQALLENA